MKKLLSFVAWLRNVRAGFVPSFQDVRSASGSIFSVNLPEALIASFSGVMSSVVWLDTFLGSPSISDPASYGQ